MIDFDKRTIENVKKLIIEAENIYIASHIQPDGDNLGSSLGLYLALKKINPNIGLVKVDEIPKSFLFLPSIDKIEELEEDLKADLFISLDCGDLDRLGYAKNIFTAAKNTINIDHHRTNASFGDYNFVYPEISSTSELVYELIRALDIEIDKDIATCIYTGISTDTGSFKYSSTSSRTYEIASELLDYGIDLNKIIINVYQSRSLASTKVYIDVLNTLEFHFNDKLSTLCVEKDMIEKNGASWDDAEGFISFARDIENIEVAAIFKEHAEEDIKVSLRSKEYIDVSLIAEKFNGGGHKKAAGCSIDKPLDQAKKMIIEEIEKHIR